MSTTVVGPITRSSSEPFTIFLNDGTHQLTRTQLLQQVGGGMQRRGRWYFPTVKLTSFVADTLRYSLTHNTSCHEVNMRLEPEKLHLSCNCNSPVETICLHAFKALEKLVHTAGGNYFGQFAPNGIIELAAKYPRCFEEQKMVNQETGPVLEPRACLRPVFHLTKGAHGEAPALLDRLPGTGSAATPHSTELCFVMVRTGRSALVASKEQLPVLVPCMGTLSRTGEKVKQFGRFLSGVEKERQHLLTADQQALNQLGLAMLKLAEQLPGSVLELLPGQEETAVQLMGLWEQSLPLLRQQGHVFHYRLYNPQALQGKPEKSRMLRTRVGKERPRLSFELRDKGAYLVLTPVLLLHGKRVTDFEDWMPLFAAVKGVHFLVSSLRDAATLEWMAGFNNRITVFKEHLAGFEKEVLQPLERFYEVRR